ncbi:hypothetical protein DL765_011603 [Monosporascus sp. GIB2]|nr:hypothetical protein DL765_011603 [Monosporascus sp. GIB2]
MATIRRTISVSTVSPRSFLFYIAAAVDLGGRHRRWPPPCARAMTLGYTNTKRIVQPSRRSWLSLLAGTQREIGRDLLRVETPDAPQARADYSDLRMEYGVVVLDISALDNVRYSINRLLNRLLELGRFKELSYEASASAVESEDSKTLKCVASASTTSAAHQPTTIYALRHQRFSKGATQGVMTSDLGTRDNRGCTYSPPIDAFPVQQMFVRHQLDISEEPKFWPNYFFLGNVLLDLERFAAGLLAYIPIPRPDTRLFSFPGAPLDISMHMEEEGILTYPKESSPGLPSVRSPPKTSPFPSGAPSPPRPEAPPEPRRSSAGPKARDLGAGSWTVLVSRERCVNAEVLE